MSTQNELKKQVTALSDRSWNDYGISFGDLKRMCRLAKNGNAMMHDALCQLKVIHVLVDPDRKPDSDCYPEPPASP